MTRAIILFAFFLFSSCTWNEIEVQCVPDEQVFLSSVKPIIDNHCVSCHNIDYNESQAELGTYEGVIHAVNNYSLREEVISLEMPPSYTMTEEEINIIKNWIDCD